MPDDLHPSQTQGNAGSSRPSYRIDQRPGGLDAGTKRLLTFAGLAVAALLVLGGGWALMARRPAGVPIIQADSRPLKVKPDNPGGMQIAGADEPDDGATALAPAPEAPAPLALRAQVQANRPAPAPAPSPAVAPPTAVAGAMPAPAPTPAPAAPAPVVATRPAVPAAKSAAGGTMVQLAALDSEAAAKTEWARLAKKFPELLTSRQPVFERAEKDGQPIYRIRTGGFADIADATSFCGKMRAKGGGCSLASF